MEITAFFVYGTLKQGQIRENCWPRQPIKISIARVKGDLYDLGDYPALAEGPSLVQGEAWKFEARDVAATLHALDRVEWFQQDDTDLYVRKIVSATKADGEELPCFCYYYANKIELQSARKIRPNRSGVCDWHK